MVKQEGKKRVALLLAQANNPSGEARVDIERLLARHRVAADDGVRVLDGLATDVAAVRASLRASDLLKARVDLQRQIKTLISDQETRPRAAVDRGRTASSPSRKAWTAGDSRLYASRWSLKMVSPPLSGESSRKRVVRPSGCSSYETSPAQAA